MKISKNSKWLVGLFAAFFLLGCEPGGVTPEKPVNKVPAEAPDKVPGNVGIPINESPADEASMPDLEGLLPEEKTAAEEAGAPEEAAADVPSVEEGVADDGLMGLDEEMMPEPPMEEMLPEEDKTEFKRDELGFNVISEEGQVLNEEGEVARTDVEPLSEGAPQQTGSLEDKDVPEHSIVLEISKLEGYVPAEFTVKKGEAVTIAVKSVDDKVHIFRFKDDVLKAVAVGVMGGETRAISFNAPDKAGEYEFFSDVPGQKDKIGKMIVE